MVRDLSKENSIFNEFIAEIRDAQIQKDSLRFRRNLERIGEVMAYEISKTFPFEDQAVITPLGTANGPRIAEQPVLATILRAGLPMHQGLLNYFDRAESSFISAYRKHHKNADSFEVELEYMSSPDITDRVLIVSDPMLATGRSMVLCHRALIQKQKPSRTHVVIAIASTEGVTYVRKHLPSDTMIWVGAIDEEMTAQAYIVPGLGDAGDLAFGVKM